MHEVSLRTTPPLKVTAYGLTDIGKVRVHNEDAVLLRPELGLYVVADGAGGHNAGNVASALATSSIANYFEGTQLESVSRPDIDDFGFATGARRLSAAIQRANKDVVEVAKSSNRFRGMGTTVVAIHAQPQSGLVHVAHVGDSRCYRLRGGQLEQLTHDHSLINDVLELRPDIDDAKVSSLPRHVVTRALGMAENTRVAIRTHQLLPDDRYLLCSDGLTDALDDETIGWRLGEPVRNAEDLARGLVSSALAAGGEDNIGVLVLKCEAAPDTASQEPPRHPKMQKRVAYVPPDIRGTFGSAPEIIIVGTESIPDSDEPAIHVVPAESATPGLLGAFAGLRRRTKPPQGQP